MEKLGDEGESFVAVASFKPEAGSRQAGGVLTMETAIMLIAAVVIGLVLGFLAGAGGY